MKIIIAAIVCGILAAIIAEMWPSGGIVVIVGSVPTNKTFTTVSRELDNVTNQFK